MELNSRARSNFDASGEAEAAIPVITIDDTVGQGNALCQSRAEADSSTVNDQVVNDESLGMDEIQIENNEAEAECDLAIRSSVTPSDNNVSVDAEEATGSNIVDNETSEAAPEDAEDPYAYLNRDEFSSERFKIEIKGLPKYYGYGELRKLLNDKLLLKSHKIKPLHNGLGCAFVNFRCEEDRVKALETLNNFEWKKQVLSATPAKPAPDPLVRKRTHKQAMLDNDDEPEVKESATELVRKATSPWSTVPYDEQLERKIAMVNDVVKLIHRGIANVSMTEVPPNNYPVKPILPSPAQKGYRNKCEFTIGYNPDTNEKTVGFRASSYKKGSTIVGPIDALEHIPQVMKDVVQGFQTFIRSSDPDFDPYDPETHNGLWKQLTVRVSRSGQVLVVLLISGKYLDDDLLTNIKVSIKDYYSNDPVVTTFLIKVTEFPGETERNKPEPIFGDGYIIEDLMGLKFRVSAEAFFQVNTAAAEVLYSAIKSVSDINSKTTVLDVCCGTGTIGLCLAKECSQVIGIEMNEEAVSDAKANSSLNGLESKCRFYASKAENVLEAIFSRLTFDSLVAIVDPPRAGLHNKVIQTLRRNEKLNKLVYVSCDPKSALKNFIDLSRPTSKNYKGEPFFPTKFIPVDLFPDSPHYELIIVFERITQNPVLVSE